MRRIVERAQHAGDVLHRRLLLAALGERACGSPRNRDHEVVLHDQDLSEMVVAMDSVWRPPRSVRIDARQDRIAVAQIAAAARARGLWQRHGPTLQPVERRARRPSPVAPTRTRRRAIGTGSNAGSARARANAHAVPPSYAERAYERQVTAVHASASAARHGAADGAPRLFEIFLEIVERCVPPVALVLDIPLQKRERCHAPFASTCSMDPATGTLFGTCNIGEIPSDFGLGIHAALCLAIRFEEQLVPEDYDRVCSERWEARRQVGGKAREASKGAGAEKRTRPCAILISAPSPIAATNA